MRISDLIASKYLTKQDFPTPTTLTIDKVVLENVARPGEQPCQKGVMRFREKPKGLPLNSTNLRRAERMFGTDETDRWAGQRVIVFHDENVEFQGKLIGGLRLRPAE